MAEPTREEFLARRKKGIGGSDASVVIGLNPWKSPHELYLEKRGEIEPADLDDVERIYWGNVLEDTVARAYSERTGRKVRRRNALLRHPSYEWMLANIDRDVVGESRILEVKTTSAFAKSSGEWGEAGTDLVPDHYLVQVQHYLAVTGAELADLAVLFGGQEMRIYTIPRDEELIQNLVDAEFEFWEGVTSGTPPEVDYYHPSALEVIKRRYPGTNGQSIILPPGTEDLHDALVAIKEQAKQLKAEQEAITARLLDAMGDAAIGLLPGGAGSYRRRVVEAKEISYTRNSYVDFRYSKKND